MLDFARRRLHPCFVLSFALAACGGLVATDPALSPAERNAALRSMPRPALERDDHYESTSVEREVPIPLDAFGSWFERSGAPNLSSFVSFTSRFPGIARSEPLRGAWDRAGDRRRLIFSNGSSGVEELVVHAGPRLYVSQVWNVTNPLGRYISYAVGQFVLAPTEAGTRIRWTYFFRPKAWPDGLFIRSTVHDEVRELMHDGLAAMTKQALADRAD